MTITKNQSRCFSSPLKRGKTRTSSNPEYVTNRKDKEKVITI